MLGLPGWMKPEFIWKMAGPWLLLSVCIERITHRSSA